VYKRAKELLKNSKVDVCVSKFCVATGHTRLSRPLLDGYIHVVDILRWFCGEPVKVRSCAEYDDPYHEKSIVSLIDFDSDAIGVQISNFNGGGYIEEVEMFGGGKTIKADTVAQTTSSIKGGGRNPIVLNEFSTSQWHRLVERLGYAEQNRHFIECVKRHRKPLASGDDALKTHLLVAEIYSACGLPSMYSRA
jgi:virulence factor